MINIQTQTYYNRSTNASTTYDAKDFYGEVAAGLAKDQKLGKRLDAFIDRVAPRVERQLQSNEIINVFQDDFEQLGDELTASSSANNTVNAVPRQFYDQDSNSKYRNVTCIKFHPTKPHLVAMSIVESLDFEQRAEVMGKSFESQVLILNFSDVQVINAQYALQTPVEISAIEFAPENPKVLIGGCINGQLISWDLNSTEHKISEGRKSQKPEAAAATAEGAEEEEE